ncbi:MAG: NUDIX domain-containing protein [Enterobacterales bacterium]|nr:NUDIX domain-containing protein [Enterobacterales bacterium]
MMQYQLLEQKSLYSGFFKLQNYRLKHQLFQGGWSQEFTREILQRGNAAGVLLFDPKTDQLVLIEQFRPGAIESDYPWIMEVVAGMIESDETPKQVVQREAIEESGVQIKGLKLIHHYYSSPGGSDEQIWLFIGQINIDQIAEYAGLENENEDIKVHRLAATEVFDWLKKGKINNAMTIIALQWLQLQPERNLIFD